MREKNEIKIEWKAVKEFNQKFESHYEIKKKIFKQSEVECLQLKQKLDICTQEIFDLKNSVKLINEERGYLSEKNKTLSFENQQLRSHKDVLSKKLNETHGLVESSSFGGSLTSINSIKFQKIDDPMSDLDDVSRQSQNVLAAFNRFDAISENEFEQMNVYQKNFNEEESSEMA